MSGLRMFKLLSRFVGGLFFAGCAVHPLPDQVTRQSTVGIVTAIRCEARQAILEHASAASYNDGAIGYIFDFNIMEENSAGLDMTFKKPFGNGEFDLTLSGANADLKRQAERKFTIIDTFGELKRAVCSDEIVRSRFKYPIAGSVGLNEVISTFMGLDRLGGSTFDPGSTTIGGQTATFSDTLTYTTTLDAGAVNPTLTLNSVPGSFRLTSLSAMFRSSRTDIHTLTLAIALPEPKGNTQKGLVRAAARTTSQKVPFYGGIPSKIQIHSERDPKSRVLLELDRQVLLSKVLTVTP
jgi:hypothetical protein